MRMVRNTGGKGRGWLGVTWRTVVTDDGDMLELANDFEIRTFRVLDLLKLMLDCKHIDMQKVREIAAYLAYANDKPREYGRDYKKLFGEYPPKT